MDFMDFYRQHFFDRIFIDRPDLGGNMEGRSFIVGKSTRRGVVERTKTKFHKHSRTTLTRCQLPT